MALEKQGIPSVTLISCSFYSLGQMVATHLDYPGLPIVMLPHPVGDTDAARVRQKGIEAAAEVVRLLTTPVAEITKEFAGKEPPLPDHAVARF